MINAARNRLIWKDFREVMPLFLAGCLAFFIIIAATCFSWWGTEGFKALGPIANLISPLNMFANVCGLVLGVLLFAPEKENRTTQLLSSLPINPRSIAMTKLGFGTVCLMFFVAVCYLSVAAVGMLFGKASTGWPPIAEITGNLFIPFVCFLWGVFWSLTLRSTVYALFAAAVSVLIAESISNVFLPEPLGLPSTSSTNALIIWVLRIPIIAALIILVNQALPNWLQDERASLRVPWSRNRPAIRAFSNDRRPRGVMTSLVWQSFRQNRTLLIASAIGCIAIAIIGIFTSDTDVFAWLLLTAYVVPLFASSFVFAADHHKDRYRFFQEQSEFGRQLWLARLLPVAVLVVVATICMPSGFDAISMLPSIHGSGYGVAEFFSNLGLMDGVLLHLTPLRVLAMLLTGMAIGQFFSMFMSSPVVSVVCSMMYGMLGFGWAILMMICDASLLLFLFPVAGILLITTLVQLPRWLADRKTVFDRYVPWLSVLVAALLVMVGFFVKRAVEVPALSNIGGFNQSQIAAAYDAASKETRLITNPSDAVRAVPDEELAASSKFLEALEMLVVPAAPDDQLFDRSRYFSSYSDLKLVHDLQPISLDEIVESNQRSLALIHEAIEQNGHPIFNVQSEVERKRRMHQLEMLLWCEAEYYFRRDDSGKVIETAFALFDLQQSLPSEYLRRTTSLQLFYQWSEMAGQSSERIKTVIIELDHRMKQSRSRAEKMRLAYRQLDFQNYLDEAVTGNDELSSYYISPFVRRMLTWMPWEVERAKRIGEHLIEQSQRWDGIIDVILENPRRCFGFKIWRQFPFEESPYQIEARTSLVSLRMWRSPWLILGPQLNKLQLFRYAKVRMALSAFRLDHGAYPQTLQDLVPEYLGVIPCEVFVGGEFYYSATGLDHPAVWGPSASQSVMSQFWYTKDIATLKNNLDNRQLTPEIDEEKIIAPHVPFLLPWSSEGGQVTIKVNLTRETDTRSEIVVKQVECFDLSNPGNAAEEFNYVEVELPAGEKR